MWRSRTLKVKFSSSELRSSHHDWFVSIRDGQYWRYHNILRYQILTILLSPRSRYWRYWRYYLEICLQCCWLGSTKGIQPVKNWVVGCWLEHSNSGKKVSIRFLLPNRFFSIRFANLINLPLLHWYSNSNDGEFGLFTLWFILCHISIN